MVAVGAFVALAPPVCLTLVPLLLDIGSIVQPEIALLSLAALPASLGIAVLSRRFFGITRILRRGLLALLVWMALIGSYTAGFAALARWPSWQHGPVPFDLAAPAVTIALVAATFWPLQHRLRRALEHWLFRDVYDYRATLRELSAELVQFGELSAVARHALDRLGRTLDLSWATIELDDRPEPLRFSWGSDTVITVPGNGGGAAAVSPPVGYRVPLIADGETIGRLEVGTKRHDIDLLPEDRELIATVAPHLATALRNALLIRQLEVQVEALADRERALATLNDRLLSVQEEERRRLALDLHDDPLQRAIQLSRELGAWVDCPQAERWQEIVEDIIASLRAVCDGLHPPVLDDFGLPAGLEWLAARLRAETDLDVRMTVQTADSGPFGRLEPELELALYRVAQEALNNCLKHAQARSITVTLRREPARVLLQVADDGVGPAANGVTSESQVGLGLLGMRERLQRWQGRVTLEGGQPRGAVLTAEVRLEEGHGGETGR
ncbi:Sensor histidine kinase ComP [bacterium HR26]|nr:Sensor histidine kinase ComP [bacterium HR26]